MKISVVPAAELSVDQVVAWSQLQQGDASLVSPFFRPEFTQAVAAECPGVEVAIWEDAGDPVGFLPFERSKRRLGRPVGGSINLLQGAIARRDLAWSPRDVIRAAGLSEWRFDHLAGGQSAFSDFQYCVAQSPYLDLSQGFEHYHKSRGKSAAKFVSHILQKDRKAGRDLGRLRLEINQNTIPTLKRLFDWKLDQCRRLQVPCIFERPWVARFYERLMGCTGTEFSGMLFSLYMGDRLASAFFCLRSGNVLQGSILGYDRNLGAYAPGFVLLMRVAQAASALGITRIDTGSGRDPYKYKLASNCEPVAEGIVHARPMFALAYRGLFRLKDCLRSTPLRAPLCSLRNWKLPTRELAASSLSATRTVANLAQRCVGPRIPNDSMSVIQAAQGGDEVQFGDHPVCVG